ncbi:hypothetical protein [Methylobacterium soli]|uniref:hypothetical protein n=1 Tax=Methylobacterium soli TaxID=553447 RepID=UPI001EE2D34E|nr:hypothetical protein [Methylobacterium soli]
MAEVVDKFSGPLRALRSNLQSMSKDGASHTEAVVKGFQKVESAAKSAGTTAATTLNPALAAIGITGLSVVAAMTGVGAAIRSLGGSVSALAMLGRETSVSAENLRVLQSVMGKFGIEADASAGAIKTFAQNMRLAKDGIGPIMEFLRTQGRTAEGRAYFNQLADSLKSSKDNGEALMKALEGLEHIQDPAGRMKYAEQIFGNADIGRLGDQHLGRLRDIIEKQRKLLGPLDPATVKAAEDFEKAMSGLRGTMQRLGTAIATEAMPYVSEFVKGIESLVKDGRQDITGPLRQSVRDVGEALKSIDWAQAGKDASDFVKGATEGIKSLLESVSAVVKAIRALNEGRYAEAFRHLDGGSGPLARKLAPLPGDDKIARDEEIAKTRGQITTTREQGNLLRDVLKEAEESGDRGKAQQMRNALDLNSRRMKDLEEALRKLTDGTATVQQQSFGTDGSLAGLIHQAAYGGGGAVGSMGRVGNLLARRGGGIYLPEGGGARGGSSGGVPRISPRPGGPGEAVRRFQRGEGNGEESGGSIAAKYPDGLAAGIKQSAKDLGISAEDLATVISYETGGTFDPWKRGPTTKWGTHRGLIQWGEPQARKYGVTKDMSPGEQMRAVTRYLRDRGVKPGMGIHQVYGAINAGGVSDWHLNQRDAAAGGAPGTVREKVDNQMGAHRRKALALLRADKTDVAESGERADGAGFAARERARRAFETGGNSDFAADYRSRQAAADRNRLGLGGDGGQSLMDRAFRSPLMGGPRVENNGTVEVHVARPGPDTRVSTSASGNLFRDVRLNRGATMAQASQEN